MVFLRNLVLGLTSRTPFHGAVQGRYLAEHLATMLEAELVAAPALDPQRDPPLPWLERMCREGTATWRTPEHGLVDVLRRLVRKGEPFKARVPLREIVGITASQAGNRMNLDSIPETMRLSERETFGPLPDAEMQRLQEAVRREFSGSGEVFRLDLQRWNGAYVAGNHGASRRFALWRRLSQRRLPPEAVASVVTPHDLDPDALHALRSRWRLLYGVWDGALGAVMGAEEVLPDSFYGFGGGSSLAGAPRFWAVPYVQHVPRQIGGEMEILHRRIDEAGVLDVGRALTEQVSVAKRRHACQGASA